MCRRKWAPPKNRVWHRNVLGTWPNIWTQTHHLAVKWLEILSILLWVPASCHEPWCYGNHGAGNPPPRGEAWHTPRKCWETSRHPAIAPQVKTALVSEILKNLMEYSTNFKCFSHASVHVQENEATCGLFMLIPHLFCGNIHRMGCMYWVNIDRRCLFGGGQNSTSTQCLLIKRNSTNSSNLPNIQEITGNQGTSRDDRDQFQTLKKKH